MGVVILILKNRKALERVENSTFENVDDLCTVLRDNGMTDEEEDSLGYYELTEYMDLVNDQVLEDLTGTFLGYVTINKK